MMSAIIISDQVTKAIVQQKFYLGESVPVIADFFHFTYVRNPGAAFGMFGYAHDMIRIPLFFGVPVIACVWLLYLIWTTRNTKKLQCLAYSLIFAGAVGNLIDRFSMNYVVDFLDFFWGTHHFPAFNIADSAITIAAFILIYETIISAKREKEVLPVLFESSAFTLYAYPLFMGLAWGVGYYLTQYLFDKNHLDSKPLLPLFAGIFVTSWIGAKVFFLAVSSDHKVQQYLYADSFWGGGGFVFYGGLIFALAFYFIWSLWLKKFPFNESKFLAPGLVIGHGIGRVGCFLTGCCFGSKCDLPWAVHMHGEWIHPVQLYEAFGLFIIGYFTLKWAGNKKENFYVVTRYLIFYSLLRFVVEYFRGDKIRGVYWLNISTSQFISLAIFFAAWAAILIVTRKNLHW